jgi:2-phosphosulfolactate phosphatase
VTFVVTGDVARSRRRRGPRLRRADRARLLGDDPDPAPFLARVPTSDAGRVFAPDGPDWAPPVDLALACEVDRFDFALVAEPATTTGVVEVHPEPMG